MRSRLAVVSIAVIATISACARVEAPGVTPTPSGESPPASAPTNSALPAEATPTPQPPQYPLQLKDRSWIAESPEGWMVGAIGRPSITLETKELALAASDKWIVSAVVEVPESVELVVRSWGEPSNRMITIGAVHPGSIALVGDHVYIGGVSVAGPSDPGVLDVNLQTGTVGVLIEPTGERGGRYVLASRDGRAVVSTLCLLGAEYTGTCELDVVDLPSGLTRHLGPVEGGLPRAVGASYVVVTHQLDTAPEHLVFVDLESGLTIRSETGREFLGGYVTSTGLFVQSMLDIQTDPPSFTVETLDITGEGPQTIYSMAAEDMLPGLWSELSTDDYAVVGPWTSIDLALSRNGFKAIDASVVDIGTGELVSTSLPVGPGS